MTNENETENPYSAATLSMKLDGESWESCAASLREELERVEAMTDD